MFINWVLGCVKVLKHEALLLTEEGWLIVPSFSRESEDIGQKHKVGADFAGCACYF